MKVWEQEDKKFKISTFEGHRSLYRYTCQWFRFQTLQVMAWDGFINLILWRQTVTLTSPNCDSNQSNAIHHRTKNAVLHTQILEVPSIKEEKFAISILFSMSEVAFKPITRWVGYFTDPMRLIIFIQWTWIETRQRLDPTLKLSMANMIHLSIIIQL